MSRAPPLRTGYLIANQKCACAHTQQNVNSISTVAFGAYNRKHRLDPPSTATTRPVRRPNIADASFHNSSTVPSAANAEGSRATTVVTGSPVCGSFGHTYDNPAISQ